MPEPTDAQKEIQALQSRILGLEETISQLKKAGEERERQGKTDEGSARIAVLEKELSDLKKEKAEVQAKLWDGQTERRAKDRRLKFGGKRDSDKTGVESYIGGHFG